MIGDRCTGHCCKEFMLMGPPGRLREWADAGDEEALFIEDMIIPIEPQIVNPYTGELLPEPIPRYRCRHLQDEQCTVYEMRPSMCRRYPSGKPCAFDGCTWTAAREARVDDDGNERRDYVSAYRLSAKRAADGSLVGRMPLSAWPLEVKP